MRSLNVEMNEIMRMANDTSDAIKEMNEAFQGETETEFIATQIQDRLEVQKVSKRKQSLGRAMTAKHRALEPIYEVSNEYALVPVDNSALKKQRMERLKHRARLVSGRERSAQGLPV